MSLFVVHSLSIVQSTHHWHDGLDCYVRAQHNYYFHGFEEEGYDFCFGEVVVCLLTYLLVGCLITYQMAGRFVLHSVAVLVNVPLAEVVVLGRDPFRVSLYYYQYYYLVCVLVRSVVVEVAVEVVVAVAVVVVVVGVVVVVVEVVVVNEWVPLCQMTKMNWRKRN